MNEIFSWDSFSFKFLGLRNKECIIWVTLNSLSAKVSDSFTLNSLINLAS